MVPPSLLSPQNIYIYIYIFSLSECLLRIVILISAILKNNNFKMQVKLTVV
jgi:hypothetical protein